MWQSSSHAWSAFIPVTSLLLQKHRGFRKKNSPHAQEFPDRAVASSGDLGVENVPIELPGTLNPLNNKDFAVAFTAGRFLALGHNCSMRASPDEPQVVA